MEEFAAKRRGAQTRIEDHLRPLVRRALDGGVNTDGYRELMQAIRDEWETAYTEESGAKGASMPSKFRIDVYRTLLKTDRAASDKNTVERISVWLATAILSNSTLTAAKDDPEDLFVEWVSMDDTHVREAHKEADGQVRPIGEPFKVDRYKMDGPGDPTAPIELWINCRCTLRPVLASEALTAAARELHAGVDAADVHTKYGLSYLHPSAGYFMLPERMEFRDVPTDERNRDAKAGRAMPDGSYPIDNCGDLKNAIQAIGRAKDPGPVKAHIRRRKSSLGCPDVTLPEGWQVDSPQGAAAMDPENPPIKPEDECQNVDPDTGECLDPPKKDEPVDTKPDKPFDGGIPWHGVLAPEDVRSGDGRKFAAGSLRVRPLPLPLTWQKVSADGHSGNVTIARIDRVERVGSEMRASGVMLTTPEADELIGLISDFGKFGVSVDADDVTFEMEDESDETVFTSARIASACVVPIPAFSEAWVALGAEPEDFFPEGAEPLDQEGEEVPQEALVASVTLKEMFVDVAPGRTEDGPGWLTHPVDTDRLRDWVVADPDGIFRWGVPGDFDRCRVWSAQHIKPQHINGYCANRHYDALGHWPGPKAHAGDYLENTAPAEALNLVASAAIKAPHDWFFVPEPDHIQPLTISEDGQVSGHVAEWNQCHENWADKCVIAPKSPTNYANFMMGCVLTDKGETVATGCLTIGGGHANGRMNMRKAIAHYDDVSTAWADVRASDGKHGIWVCGWVRPGTPDEMVVAARASKLSGDWRERRFGELDMIAAHCVNTPGFGIQRVAASVQDGRQISLVAAGMVTDDPVQSAVDTNAIAKAVFDLMETARVNRERVAALAARVNGSNDGV
jgi:hypothetical protein